MGIETLGCQFLCGLREAGVDFRQCATLGRQSFFPDKKHISGVASQLCLPGGNHELIDTCCGDGNKFIKLLGAENITNIDATDYEGADTILDLNHPIPQHLKPFVSGQFSTLIDGGTIEHVFNAPQALKNSMEMVAVGGHFVALQMANNFLGHGFFQFSPEFFFAALSMENGFKVRSVLLGTPGPIDYFSVSAPTSSRERIVLCNDRPTYILVVAQRLVKCEIFRTPPQQHFYKEAWESGATAKADHAKSICSGMMRKIPSRIREAGKMILGYNRFAFSDVGFRRGCFKT
jgi:hypothetical protein